MNRLILCVCAICLPFHALAAAPVRVLDGPEVLPMRDGLKRVGSAFDDIKALDSASLAGCRVLVLCGTKPPVDESAKPALVQFLNAGGNVLGVGRGASCMIDLGLFDAEPYYMTGTTIHMTSFAGYHRLTFGYPGAKPNDGWTAGVPHLLRSTQGPLMKLGAKATAILTCGGGYSLAAFQRVGKGMVLLLVASGGSFRPPVANAVDEQVFRTAWCVQTYVRNCPGSLIAVGWQAHRAGVLFLNQYGATALCQGLGNAQPSGRAILGGQPFRGRKHILQYALEPSEQLPIRDLPAGGRKLPPDATRRGPARRQGLPRNRQAQAAVRRRNADGRSACQRHRLLA